MEFFLIVLLIVILIVILGLKKSLSQKIDSLNSRLDSLANELKKARLSTAIPEEKATKKSVLEEIVLKHQVLPVKPEPFQEEKEKIPVVWPEIKPPVAPPPSPEPGFFERNPDLEKFIGENLANKIGIGILVLGIGFFVKYAIDQDWINEIGRVFIGILCGGILLGVAHRLRKTFKAFSSVLVGGGIAVLYLTIYIAFHDYHIFSQTAAFILMLVITVFAVILSLAYNRIELAVVSILGGFGSPFMVSTGEGNYVVLFTYILILDSGMLALAYYKKWNLVNILSYAFTILLFGTWLGTRFDGSQVSMIGGAMVFATLFYLIFFAMNIVNNIKERTTFQSLDISLLLSNTFYYYGTGIVILNNEAGEDFKGLFTAALGIFNFIFAYALYKNSRVDKTLVYLLIGLVLTFISLAAPVQLEGNYITLFWSAETVLLLWLSQKSGIRLMKLASVLLMALMGISLLMDWGQIYFSTADSNMMIVLNKGYITGMFSLVSIVITLRLLKNERHEDAGNVALYKNVLMVAGIVLLYTSQLLELRHQLYAYDFDYSTQNIIIGTYNMLFISGLLLAERKFVTSETIRSGFAFWGFVAMLGYLLFYHELIVSSRNDFLLLGSSVTGLLFHYVLIGLLIVIVVLTLRTLQGLTEFNKLSYNLYSWFYVFFFVFLASAELDHSVVLIAGATSESIDHILTQNHKIGYPILWGITSFGLIFIGLKTKKKHLRIISLTLFLITLIKLFTIDIRGISEGGKIAAFISLGVLLLVVSFMYQRLKKMLLTDEFANDTSDKDITA